MGEIVIRGLTKRYGDVVAVHDLDLTIHDGEMFFLIGPSGSGKTTTLRCIAGLEEPDEGTIELDGEDVTGLQPAERDVGMIFQTFTLFPSMTPYENVAFPLKLQRVPRGEIRHRVTAIGRALRIEDLLESTGEDLSDADRQRVSLARAIARHPATLLMDEPLTFLDAKLRMHLSTELKALQRELALTTVYVTHDQLEAMSMGSRMAIMHLGRVHQDGTPHDVYTRPATTFVARFVGSPTMTMLEGEAVDGEIEVRGVGQFPAPDHRGSMFVGFRPEACRAGDGADTVGRLQVDFVEWLGSQAYVYGRIGGAEVVALGDPGSSFEPGTEVPVSLDAERLHFFDVETGLRVEREEAP